MVRASRPEIRAGEPATCSAGVGRALYHTRIVGLRDEERPKHPLSSTHAPQARPLCDDYCLLCSILRMSEADLHSTTSARRRITFCRCLGDEIFWSHGPAWASPMRYSRHLYADTGGRGSTGRACSNIAFTVRDMPRSVLDAYWFVKLNKTSQSIFSLTVASRLCYTDRPTPYIRASR